MTATTTKRPAKRAAVKSAPDVTSPERRFAVVGLDLSLTSTGVCLPNGAALRIDGTKLRGMARVSNIVRRIGEIIDAQKPGLVAIEGYSYASQTDTIVQLGELGGIVRWELFLRSIGWLVAAPAAVKIYATGDGKAKKTPMVIAARERLGYEGDEPDEADAIWLRALALDWLGDPLVKLPETHRRALRKLDLSEVDR